MTYKNVVNHLHISAFCDHLQGRIQQRKIQGASCIFLYFSLIYEGGHKNNENFFLEGRGMVLPSAPACCVYVTALRISWPSGVLEEMSTGSV